MTSIDHVCNSKRPDFTFTMLVYLILKFFFFVFDQLLSWGEIGWVRVGVGKWLGTCGVCEWLGVCGSV